MSATVENAEETSEQGAAPADLYSMLFGRSDPTLEVVSAGHLTRVGARPPLGAYLRQTWQRRHFVWAESRAHASNGTRETALGRLWLVGRPLLDGLTYFLIFGLLMRSSNGIENFVGYLVIGVFLFSFTNRCVTTGARSVAAARNLIRAFTFPRASLPIAVVVREGLTMLPVLGAMFALLAVFPPVEHWSWRLALVPAILLLQGLFTAGLAMLLARLVATFPDLNQLVGFATRLWLYGSAVFFSYERFLDHPTVLALMEANPMFVVLDMVRDCVLYGVSPTVGSWLSLAAWSFGVAVLGFVVFWQAEESYGRV